MNKRYIDLHLLVDRYLDESLSDNDMALFEERLVWDQELLSDLHLAEKFRQGLKAYEVQDDEPSTLTMQHGWRSTSWLTTPMLATAASILLTVSIGINVLLSLKNDVAPDDTFLQAQTPQIVPVLTTRSNEPIILPIDPDSWTVLLIEASQEYSIYRISIRKDEDGADAVWMQDGMRMTYPDSLAVGLPGRSLSPGNYVLNLDALPDSEMDDRDYILVNQMNFRTVAKP